MKFILAEKNKYLAKLDITPCPFSLLINKAEVYEPDIFSIKNTDPEALKICKIEDFLNKREVRGCSHEYDDKALKILGLKGNEYLFGRMNEYFWAVAFVSGFTSPKDDIYMRPERSELLSFVYFGEEWSRLYLLKGVKDE